MKYVEEPLKKEIERMLFLSGKKLSTKTPVNESEKKSTEVIKEDDEREESGLFSDFDTELAKAAKNKAISTAGEKVELPTAMKLAMVLNRLEATDAASLGAHIGWEPKTQGASQNLEKGTTQNKWPIEKLGSTEKKEKGSVEKHGMQPGFEPVTLPDSSSPNMTDAEKKETAKWLSHSKDRFIISYAGGTLTPTGKAQIEFLARTLSNNPLNYKDEKKLFNSKYMGSAQSNAYGILYDFYKHAMIPIMIKLGNRAKYTPYDSQVDIMITDGLEHALEQTVMGKYDAAAGNFGAWLMQSVKNKSVDYLRSITDFKFDAAHVSDMLNSIKGPFTIISDLDPSKAYGNFDGVTTSTEHPGYWTYTYNSAINALGDFTAPAISDQGVRKSSPLKSEHLLNPSMFYKGYAKDLKGANIDTEQPFEMETELFKINKLPAEAKQEVYAILDKVSDEIITNYKEYGIKNIASSLRVNKDLFKDVMFALLNFGGLIDVYKTSFTAKNGSVYPVGSPAKKDNSGNIEKDNKGRTPETETVWTVKGKGEDSAMDDFALKIFERAQAKYGQEGLPVHLSTNPVDFIRKVYGAVRYYFGFRGLESPIVKANRDNLNAIMKNYEQATLAEARKLKATIKNILAEEQLFIESDTVDIDITLTCQSLLDFLFEDKDALRK